MRRLPHLIRGALALTAGVLFALVVAAPAAAAPIPFVVNDVGEDACTFYEAAGDAEWEDLIIQPTVDIVGKASTTVEDERCLDVEPKPRHVRFTAYSQDRPVDEHREPLSNSESVSVFDFTLTGDATSRIDYVTVAICLNDDLGGQPGFDCTEPVVLKP
ncbi:hypothetical protein AB0B28_13245 [Glycomyces sp. NPDC046736]|uniref:hypothetical protein n=1 Tax=Glycomyces sp. NPDC046736 TaxID=3155615 RepID=UPI0033C27FE7